MTTAMATAAPELAERPSALKEQFEDLEQQHEASMLGMWLFLATEILFFGGLFTAYTIYRWRYPMVFDQASNHLDLALGTINTILLLISSFTMAMAVRAAQLGRRQWLILFLGCTALLGVIFVAIKLYEWHLEAAVRLLPGPSFVFPGGHAEEAQLFFWLYFGMTGLHALHLFIGICAVLGIMIFALIRRRAFPPTHHAAVDIVGLYWHYIDIVWIFLYPLLYLGGRHLLS
jgi:cytochrome c oxidase subunit 3